MKAYVVSANSDMTEGRGPMRMVCVYDNPEAAVEHIRDAKGVMGYGKPENVELNKYHYYAYGNDHQVEEVELLKSYVDRRRLVEAEERAKALGKLTDREKQLLGVK